jgi:sterol desaturase/sphingolipid hydroxylase (fatty acid hydroxylase superfamily)
MDTALNVALLAIYGGLIALDFLAPARRYPKMRRWRLKGLGYLALYVALSIAGPLFWDAMLAEHRLVDATDLGTWGGAFVGLLVFELAQYAWHRALHSNNVLWRGLHQMHHSAERVDIYSAFIFHPLDVLAFAFVGSFSLVWMVGITAQAAILTNAALLFLAMFQHSNLRTPRWLGWFVVRPEMHALHHERGVHASNYTDLPLIDWIFGTYRNPARVEAEAGFYDGASERVLEMLVGKDVSEPREAGRPLGERRGQPVRRPMS